MSEFHNRQSAQAPLRVLTLDGGGAKGFYTLGVLKEIEAMVSCPLHQRFHLRQHYSGSATQHHDGMSLLPAAH